MTVSSDTILISTLAEYQTRFWIPVARRLRDAGRDVLLLAFDDRSAEMAKANDVPVINMYRAGLKVGAADNQPGAIDARIASYGLDGTNLLFSHERVMFGIRNSAALRRRFMIYSNAMEMVLDQLAARHQKGVVVQELGGFLSVIACFHAARKRGIRNWFIEPSFFRGRLNFTPDSLAAPDTMATPAETVSPDVRAYLDRDLAAARHRHPAKGPASIFRRVQQGRQRPQRTTPRRKALGPVRPSANIRNSVTIFGMQRCMRKWRSVLRGSEALPPNAGNAVHLLSAARTGRHGANPALARVSRSSRDHRFPVANNSRHPCAGGEGTSGPDRRGTGKPAVRIGTALRQFRAAAAANQQLRGAQSRRRRGLGQQQVRAPRRSCSASRSWSWAMPSTAPARWYSP